MYEYKERKKSNMPGRYQNSSTIQRLKIRLDNSIPPAGDVLLRLEQFNFPNQGTAVINADTLANRGYRSNAMIAANENIILLGHGIRPSTAGPGHGDAVLQAGYDAFALANVANSVNRPLRWNGSILLAGCNTAGLIQAVSEEYYAMDPLNRAVKVTGTNYKISIRDGIGNPFIGTEWEDLDNADRPHDYDANLIQLRDDYRDIVLPAFRKVYDYIQNCEQNAAGIAPHTIAAIRALDAPLRGVLASIPANLALKPNIIDMTQVLNDICGDIASIIANNDQNQNAFYNAHIYNTVSIGRLASATYMAIDDSVQMEVDLDNPALTPHMAEASKRRRKYILAGAWVDA